MNRPTRLLKAFLVRCGIVSLMAVSLSTGAADIAPLFSPAAVKGSNTSTLFRLQIERGVRRAKLADVDLAVVDRTVSTTSASALSLDLFDGTTLVIDRERFVARTASNYTWYGTVRGHPNGRAILTVVDGRMAGSIYLMDPHNASYAIYQIEPMLDGLYAIKEIQQDLLPPEEPGHFHAPSDGGSKDAVSADADAGDVIDVLVVFSNQTAAAAGAGIGAQIQSAIDNTNQVYANSGINQRLRLVHYEQVSYDEHGSDVFSTALSDVTNAVGGMAVVPGLRNAFGADLVSVMIENAAFCGIAWVGPSASHGFSVVNRGCTVSNNTFAHELGHNMGALHDPYQDPSIQPFTYGHGYVSLSGRFRTVMAYNDQCAANGFNCTRVPYMSNPNLTLNGFPLGTQQNDPTPTSNVARVLNQTALTVANFRASVVSSCTYAINPTSVNAISGSSSGSIDVTAGSGCAWSAASNAGFLTVTGGETGAGNGTVNFSVAANSGGARSGTLTVAGLTFTVNQSASGGYSLSPTNVSFDEQNAGSTGWPQTVLLTNTGASTLTINGLTMGGSNPGDFIRSGSCAVGALGAGQSCTLAFTFVAPQTTGVRSATFTVATSLGSPAIALSGISVPYSLIVNYYQSALHRPPYGGTPYWNGEIARLQGLGVDAKESLKDIGEIFLGGAEYRARNSTNGEYVTDLYQALLGRAPDEGGLSYWSGQLGSGMVRSELLTIFRFSSEFDALVGSFAGNVSSRAENYEIMDYYVGFMGRLPDSGGFNYWAGLFKSAQCSSGAATVVWNVMNSTTAQFAASAEYVNRGRTNSEFVTDLYRALMRRDGGASGVSYWASRLAGGMTREQVRQAFMGSSEMSARASAIAAQGCAGG